MKDDVGYLDWFVFTKKTTLMQRLSDYLRHGYQQYVEGTISKEKAGWFCGKQHLRYGVADDRFSTSRKRKLGKAVFHLLVLAIEGEENLRWWLLRTEGETFYETGHELGWRDALKDRINLTGYELLRLAKIGVKNPVWTWRYSADRYEGIRESILRAIRTKRDDELRQLIKSIFATPGFAGARDQVKKLAALIRHEWKRSRGSDQMPEIPSRLAYVRRIPDRGLKLSELGIKKRSKRRIAPQGSKGAIAVGDISLIGDLP